MCVVRKRLPEYLSVPNLIGTETQPHRVSHCKAYIRQIIFITFWIKVFITIYFQFLLLLINKIKKNIYILSLLLSCMLSLYQHFPNFAFAFTLILPVIYFLIPVKLSFLLLSYCVSRLKLKYHFPTNLKWIQFWSDSKS